MTDDTAAAVDRVTSMAGEIENAAKYYPAGSMGHTGYTFDARCVRTVLSALRQSQAKNGRKDAIIRDAAEAFESLVESIGETATMPCQADELCGEDLCATSGCVVDRARRLRAALTPNTVEEKT